MHGFRGFFKFSSFEVFGFSSAGVGDPLDFIRLAFSGVMERGSDGSRGFLGF